MQKFITKILVAIFILLGSSTIHAQALKKTTGLYYTINSPNSLGMNPETQYGEIKKSSEFVWDAIHKILWRWDRDDNTWVHLESTYTLGTLSLSNPTTKRALLGSVTGAGTSYKTFDGGNNLITTTADTVYLGALRPYKVYSCKLTQATTAAPSATVLENTLGGTVVWGRTSAGVYTATVSSPFTSAALTAAIVYPMNAGAGANYSYTTWTSTSVMTLSTLSESGDTAADFGGIMYVEFRVYQ